MRNSKLIFIFLAFLAVVLATGCKVHVSDSEHDECTVIIVNDSDNDFAAEVWTDTDEIFDGTIRAGRSKEFHVSESGKVYARFESSGGRKSTMSGYARRGKTMVFEL